MSSGKCLPISCTLVIGPRGSVQKRPTGVISKPANGSGPKRLEVVPDRVLSKQGKSGLFPRSSKKIAFRSPQPRFLEVAHGSSHGFSGAEESVQSTPTTEIRSCEKKARRAPNSWLGRLESLIERDRVEARSVAMSNLQNWWACHNLEEFLEKNVRAKGFKGSGRKS